jgi:hypothetical protein
MQFKSIVATTVGMGMMAVALWMIGSVFWALFAPDTCRHLRAERRDWSYRSLTTWGTDSYGNTYDLLTPADRARRYEQADALQASWAAAGCQGSITDW